LLGCTKGQVRSALEGTALDLGAPGRDDSYGHGLIQAKAAIDSLEATCGGGGPAPNQPPTAGFTSACTDLACTFTNTSADSDGSISSSTWDFGDGGNSSSTNTSHTYVADGTYTVTLTVTDDDGASDTESQSVTVTSGGGGGGGGGGPTTGFTITVYNAGKEWFSRVAHPEGVVGAFSNGATCSGEAVCQSNNQRKKDSVMTFTPEGGAPITIVF
jgi:PKD repeat protein